MALPFAGLTYAYVCLSRQLDDFPLCWGLALEDRPTELWYVHKQIILYVYYYGYSFMYGIYSTTCSLRALLKHTGRWGARCSRLFMILKNDSRFESLAQV